MLWHDRKRFRIVLGDVRSTGEGPRHPQRHEIRLPRVLARVPELAVLVAGTGRRESRHPALLAASAAPEWTMLFLGFRIGTRRTISFLGNREGTLTYEYRGRPTIRPPKC